MSDVALGTELAKVIYIIDGTRLVINRGSRNGLKTGDRFLVFGYGPELTDPDTGADLGRLEVVRGRAQVTHAQDELATLQSTERRPRRAMRRIVREASRAAAILAQIEGRVIEEELEPDEELPFMDPEVGDFAKPI